MDETDIIDKNTYYIIITLHYTDMLLLHHIIQMCYYYICYGVLYSPFFLSPDVNQGIVKFLHSYFLVVQIRIFAMAYRTCIGRNYLYPLPILGALSIIIIYAGVHYVFKKNLNLIPLPPKQTGRRK